MRFTKKAANLMFALITSAAAAGAQEVTFAGSAQGAFDGGTASAPGGCTTLLAGLTYCGSTFSGTTSKGFLSFGGDAVPLANLNNFGSFTLSSVPRSYNGNTFELMLTFLQPTAVQGGQTQSFGALLRGNVSTLGNGGVSVRFDGPDNPRTLAFDGGTFTVEVNNVSINPGRTASVTGDITAAVVPEPSTYALMGAGLVGLVGAARRRRAA